MEINLLVSIIVVFVMYISALMYSFITKKWIVSYSDDSIDFLFFVLNNIAYFVISCFIGFLIYGLLINNTLINFLIKLVKTLIFLTVISSLIYTMWKLYKKHHKIK